MKNWSLPRAYLRTACDIWSDRQPALRFGITHSIGVPIRFSFKIISLAIANLILGYPVLALGTEPPRKLPPNSIDSTALNGTKKEIPLAQGETVPAKGRTAFVSVPNTFIYSGPAEEFYPTAQLHQGTAVEVFHQTESGWAAIRPPTGSFSWIPASEVFLLPGGKTAEVTSNSSVSWIGTSLGTAKQYRWQVRLNKGEQLIVVNEDTIKDADGRESLWYQISPPNGEFRWIQSGVIAGEPPAALTKQVNKATPSSEVDEEAEEVNIQPASYDGIVIHSSDGEVVDGQMITEGEVIVDGEIIDEGIYYEDPSLEDEYYGEPETLVEPDASWDDWQLFEFTDEGLRFPLWERALSKQANLHDPLQHDPFSLAMAPKAKGPRLRSAMHDEVATPIQRRRTAWRDPRVLAQQRLQGYPQASAERGSGATLSAIRDSLKSASSGQANDSIQSPSFNSPMTTPDYHRDPNQPRPAPSLDQGTGAAASNLGIAQGFSEGGSWLSRNWNGLQQQFAGSGTSIMNSGSAALMQLQNRLNEIVTQPMIQWNFGSIKGQVQQLIHGGQSPVERGQARLLLERIEAFELLASRSGFPMANYSEGSSVNFGHLTAGHLTAGHLGAGHLGTGQLATGIPNFQAPPLISPASYARPLTDEFSALRQSGVTQASASSIDRSVPLQNNGKPAASTIPFEATGWLVPVFATTAGQPTHAITDDTGRIVAYVTGLPGMNLDRYINQAVGIHGLRGYLPQLQAAHIEAQNVVRVR